MILSIDNPASILSFYVFSRIFLTKFHISCECLVFKTTATDYITAFYSSSMSIALTNFFSSKYCLATLAILSVLDKLILIPWSAGS